MSQIFVIDSKSPEDLAMMQALYSRSALSVTKHLEKVNKTGSGKFMESFYVGYGHESIGDCGSTAIFIENVSILAAKAIQDWPLYSGQETSTRYIDFSKQSFTDPINTPESKKILQDWMDFYLSSQEKLGMFLKEKYPIKVDETLTEYNKAIKARCFDILRGFLPTAINTQLSWHTNLRQAANKLALLIHHPDKIIARLAEEILKKLQERYPHSFTHKKYPETEKYREEMMKKYTYFDRNMEESDEFFQGLADIFQGKLDEVYCKTSITRDSLIPYMDAIKTRPIKTELPGFLADLGTVTFDFFLDFGSFRDLQRHRNGVCRMPILTTNYGFHPWYLEQLPEGMRGQAVLLIARLTREIEALQCDEIVKQYYIPMGFRVPCHVTYGLPAALYVIELRSGTTVHSTLRQVAHKMNDALLKKLPEVVVHVDKEADEWDVRRGRQDIVPLS